MSKAGEALLRELRSLRVLVIHPSDTERSELVNQLKRIGCMVSVEWPMPTTIAPEIDTIFCLVEDASIEALPWVRPHLPIPVVAIIQFEHPTVIRSVLEIGVTGFIGKPIRTFGVLTALIMARSIHRYERIQSAKIAKLKESLKSQRIIAQAVQTLCKTGDIGEEEAYELLRKQATNKRLSMLVISESIINASELLTLETQKSNNTIPLRSAK